MTEAAISMEKTNGADVTAVRCVAAPSVWQLLVVAGVLTAGALVAPQRALAVPGLAGFCARWMYQYTDQGFGEDKLLHDFALPWGQSDAAYSYQEVTFNGVPVWKGYANAEGCTGPFPGVQGIYTYTVWTKLKRVIEYHYPDNDLAREIIISTEKGKDPPSYSQAVPIFVEVPNAFTQYTQSFGLGALPVSTAAVASEVLKRDDIGAVDDFELYVYADQQCPLPEFNAACFDASSGQFELYLHELSSGEKIALKKTITAHEIGHFYGLFNIGGLVKAGRDDYGHVVPPTQGACRCDHVTNSNQSHCIQSREHIWAAQWEGFAHFFAADILNTDGPDAIFPYYKQVMFFLTFQPPVPINLANPQRWMETFCVAPDAGTELDWAAFYWDLRRKGTNRYSAADLSNVYAKACRRARCGWNGQDIKVTWNMLADGAAAAFNPGSPKANRLLTTGSNHGVDH